MASFAISGRKIIYFAKPPSAAVTVALLARLVIVSERFFNEPCIINGKYILIEVK